MYFPNSSRKIFFRTRHVFDLDERLDQKSHAQNGKKLHFLTYCTNSYYIISGIKAILQDPSVKTADDEGVSPSSSVTHEFPVICFSPRVMYNILSTAANY
jgi:hypothetical protein